MPGHAAVQWLASKPVRDGANLTATALSELGRQLLTNLKASACFTSKA